MATWASLLISELGAHFIRIAQTTKVHKNGKSDMWVFQFESDRSSTDFLVCVECQLIYMCLAIGSLYVVVLWCQDCMQIMGIHSTACSS